MADDLNEERAIYRLVRQAPNPYEESEPRVGWVVTLASGQQTIIHMTTDQAVYVEEHGYQNKIRIANSGDTIRLIPPFGNPGGGGSQHPLADQIDMEFDPDRGEYGEDPIRQTPEVTGRRYTIQQLQTMNQRDLRDLAREYEVYGDMTYTLTNGEMSAQFRSILIRDLYDVQEAEHGNFNG